MKKVINGLRYDTEKSIRVGSYEFSNSRDFNWVFETLYQTPRSKKFFLAGEGGANTKYRTTVAQNTWSGGDGLFPLEREEALDWAERYLDPEIIDEFFGDMIEDA